MAFSLQSCEKESISEAERPTYYNLDDCPINECNPNGMATQCKKNGRAEVCVELVSCPKCNDNPSVPAPLGTPTDEL